MGCARFVYNWALAAQRCARAAGESQPSIDQLDKELTQLKRTSEFGWLAQVSSVALQQSLRDLRQAWDNFFAKRAAPPSFKRRRNKQSVRYTTRGFSVRGNEVRLAKMRQPLNICWSRPLPSAPTSATVIRDTVGHYFISFVVQVPHQPLPPTPKVVGIDLGLTHFCTLSDGEKINNPRYLQKDQARLRRAQRKLSKTDKGSQNRGRARVKVARIQAKIARKRADFLHKLSMRLVRENQAIAVESLHVAGMVRNRSLARAISDAGWGRFVAMLTYKCAWYGRTLIQVDRFFPSTKTCSCCGHKLTHLPLSVRQWTCPTCGTHHDRDTNAAINIARAAGLAVSNACRDETSGQSQQLHLLALA